MTPKEHISYWKKAADEAGTVAEEYITVLKKLVFVARTSGGWERDELLCSVCDEAEQLLLGLRDNALSRK